MEDRSDKIPLERRPADRRGFFRESLAAILGPLANVVEKRLAAVEQAMHLPAEPPVMLRPPGALAEEQFLAACDGCAKCVHACLVQAIYLIPGVDGPADAKPVINARNQPCVVCESLACMPACPTGALVPTPREQIDMGLAVLDESLCVRTAGQACTACVQACPIGRTALHLQIGGEGAGNLARVVVESAGCVGCGLCEFRCPTEPRAIAVTPHR